MSITTAGANIPDTSNLTTSISEDGRYVVLAGRNAAGRGVTYLRDRQLATTTVINELCFPTSTLSTCGAISADGSTIAFQTADALIAEDTNFDPDIYVRDVQTSALTRISVDSAGNQADGGSGYLDTFSINADGRVVAFSSQASNLVPQDSNQVQDIFVRDRCTTGYCGQGDLDGDGAPNEDDNCPAVGNSDQASADRNFIDHSPPYMPAVDDKTDAMSDSLGDACDGDADNDAIANADESSPAFCAPYDTTPLSRDTDGDRFLDGAECALGTDPTVFASKPPVTACGTTADSDGDKLVDRVEYCFYGTSPNSIDSDGDRSIDGSTDGCEAASFNGDRIVNVADMGMLASAIVNVSMRHVNVDVNKNGVWNPADQGLVASFIAPAGQCP